MDLLRLEAVFQHDALQGSSDISSKQSSQDHLMNYAKEGSLSNVPTATQSQTDAMQEAVQDSPPKPNTQNKRDADDDDAAPSSKKQKTAVAATSSEPIVIVINRVIPLPLWELMNP